MKTFKQFLDWVSPQTPPPEVQEAERENMNIDRGKLDRSVKRLVDASDEFAEIVAQVVRDLTHERKNGRKNEKNSSRTGKA